MQRTKPRKRPCKICRRWFMPNARQKQRQITCAQPQCQRERHRRQCQKWNRKHSAYFKANYLVNKLERSQASSDTFGQKVSPIAPKARIDLHLPQDVMIGKIGGELLIILQYVAEQIMRRNSKICSRRPP